MIWSTICLIILIALFLILFILISIRITLFYANNPSKNGENNCQKSSCKTEKENDNECPRNSESSCKKSKASKFCSCVSNCFENLVSKNNPCTQEKKCTENKPTKPTCEVHNPIKIQNETVCEESNPCPKCQPICCEKKIDSSCYGKECISIQIPKDYVNCDRDNAILYLCKPCENAHSSPNNTKEEAPCPCHNKKKEHETSKTTDSNKKDSKKKNSPHKCEKCNKEHKEKTKKKTTKIEENSEPYCQDSTNNLPILSADINRDSQNSILDAESKEQLEDCEQNKFVSKRKSLACFTVKRSLYQINEEIKEDFKPNVQRNTQSKSISEIRLEESISEIRPEQQQINFSPPKETSNNKHSNYFRKLCQITESSCSESIDDKME